MKKIVPVILMMSTLPLFFASAQNPEKEKSLTPDSNVQKKAKMNAEHRLDLSVGPAGKPFAELTVEEFQLKRDDLEGKVVELTFDRIISLKEVMSESYLALVTYHDSSHADAIQILIPKDGLDLFKDRVSPESMGTQSVYVQVLTPVTVKALGTHYIEEDGQVKYGW